MTHIMLVLGVLFSSSVFAATEKVQLLGDFRITHCDEASCRTSANSTSPVEVVLSETYPKHFVGQNTFTTASDGHLFEVEIQIVHAETGKYELEGNLRYLEPNAIDWTDRYLGRIMTKDFSALEYVYFAGPRFGDAKSYFDVDFFVGPKP